MAQGAQIQVAGGAVSICGIPVYTNRALFERTVRVERRVPGGYMNRWLIRQVQHELVVDKGVILDRVSNRLYCHPDTFEQIKRAAAAERA